MNESLMISIRGKWCGMIFSGKKTAEIRKKKPRLEPPFRCYIYECRKGVVGEFICSEIKPVYYDDVLDLAFNFKCSDEFKALLTASGLELDEMYEYLNGYSGYALCISQVTQYESPIAISEFSKCGSTPRFDNPQPLKRPPQSWCYVYEKKKGDKE